MIGTQNDVGMTELFHDDDMLGAGSPAFPEIGSKRPRRQCRDGPLFIRKKCRLAVSYLHLPENPQDWIYEVGSNRAPYFRLFNVRLAMNENDLDGKA